MLTMSFVIILNNKSIPPHKHVEPQVLILSSHYHRELKGFTKHECLQGKLAGYINAG